MLDNPVDVREYRGYKIEIYLDPYPDACDPREWDNLGTMVCFHPRYDLGDKHDYTPDELAEIVRGDRVIALPLYLLDHSGLAIDTGPARFQACDPAGWDWGMVGYIIVDKDKVCKEYNCQRITRKIRDKVLAVLGDEVRAYNAYLRGEVYGYVVRHPLTGEEIDSCWGFLGDPEESGLMDYAKATVDAALKRNPPLFEEALTG